jgi:MoaA/NifB/PqqE/SkfB family radical SAM enzyme
MFTSRDLQSSLGLVRRGLFAKRSPLLAQMVVTRFCNLDCAYCNEFDKVSKPVPLNDLLARIDDLARLDTAVVTCTGGEPLTNPHMPEVIRHIRARGMVATMNTNGFLLTREHIENLNAAGLEGMQISIDSTEPIPSSVKSLKSLRGKLELLRDRARFKINISSVMGIDDAKPEDAIEVARTARELGFSHSMSLVHGSDGQIKPFTPRQRAVYDEIMSVAGSFAHRLNHRLFQGQLIAGKTAVWQCRAGARYLYICEFGLVHWCSQNRGTPGIPLSRYTAADIAREFGTEKPCAPTCSLNCVHQASAFDEWRPRQRHHGKPARVSPSPSGVLAREGS